MAGFVHSTPVPIIYRTASKIAKKVKEGEDSLKNLIYSCKEREVKRVYALVVETFKRNDIIDDLIQKSQLLVKEPKFNAWLAKILIWELLWGKKKFKRGSKPIETIMNYEKVLRELVEDCKDAIQPVLMHDILKPRYVRVNTLKITTEEAVNNFTDGGWSLVPFHNKSDYRGFQECVNNLKPQEFIKDLHIPDLLIFPPKTQFYNHEAYKSGCIFLQDKASCLPVHLLAPPPGSIVLDTCAAPGMKTTQLAALLQNKGTLFAVEVNLKRELILRKLVESAGATCVEIIAKDVMEMTDQSCPDVEYILVDPSCSGSGITDRIEIEKLDLSTRMERLKKLCNFQAKLLRHTMKSFPKAKRIVYSTCSVNSEENEDVVRQTLETSREFKLVNAREILGSWNTKTSDICPELGNMCIFATPEEDKTNGFFVAVFERLQDGEKNPYLNYQLCKLFDKEHKQISTELKQKKNMDKKLAKDDNDNNNTLLHKHKSENTDSFLDNSIGDDTLNKEKKKKKKSLEQKKGNKSFLENSKSSELDDTLDETLNKEKKNKKSLEQKKSFLEHSKLSELDNTLDDILNKEKKKKKSLEQKKSFLEHSKSSELDNTLDDTLNKEKKKKKSLEQKKGNQSFLEHSKLSELDNTLDDTLNKGKKKKKSLEQKKGNKSFLENSKLSELDVTLEGEKKKKKIKPNEGDKNLDNSSFLEVPDCSDFTDTPNKKNKSKKIDKTLTGEKSKKRKISNGEESFNGSKCHSEDDSKNGMGKSKAKKKRPSKPLFVC